MLGLGESTIFIKTGLVYRKLCSSKFPISKNCGRRKCSAALPGQLPAFHLGCHAVTVPRKAFRGGMSGVRRLAQISEPVQVCEYMVDPLKDKAAMWV